MANKVYDLIIIGGSAVTTAAGIYAARRKLDFKIITKEFGGEIATSGDIDNWPGMPDTDGLTLSSAFRKHLEKYKADIERENGQQYIIIKWDEADGEEAREILRVLSQ